MIESIEAAGQARLLRLVILKMTFRQRRRDTMAARARDNEKYRKQKQKRLQRFALQTGPGQGRPGVRRLHRLLLRHGRGRGADAVLFALFAHLMRRLRHIRQAPRRLPRFLLRMADRPARRPTTGPTNSACCSSPTGSATPTARTGCSSPHTRSGRGRPIPTAAGRALQSLGPEVGLFRYGDMSHCDHLGTGRRIEPDIAESVRPPQTVIPDPRPAAWERGGKGQP